MTSSRSETEERKKEDESEKEGCEEKEDCREQDQGGDEILGLSPVKVDAPASSPHCQCVTKAQKYSTIRNLLAPN